MEYLFINIFTIDLVEDIVNEMIKEPQTQTVLTQEKVDGFKETKSKEICSICLGVLGDCIKLPCNHCFHKDCVGRWLTTKSDLCPLCKNKC